MRSGLDKVKLQALFREIGRKATSPGRVYVVGGATALLLGIRSQTVDVDIKLDPEPGGIFEAIAELKEALDLNVELASPDQFLPELPGWRRRSEFISKAGEVEFWHYDFYAQALAKILRGHEKDIADAKALIELGRVDPLMLKSLFDQIEPGLLRFPAINADEYRQRVELFVEECTHGGR